MMTNRRDTPMPAQATFIGQDDQAFRKERARGRRGRHPEPIPLPDGPCCGRCRHWLAPHEGETYGMCRAVVQVASGSNKGKVYGPGETREPNDACAPLSCGQAFSCRSFAAIEAQEAA